MWRIFISKISKVECLPLRVLQAVYAVDFGRSSGEPSCSCLDWNKWNIPCKHFFAVFRLIPNWNWNCLPFSYRSSPYLSTENALQSLPSTTNVMPSSSTQVGEVCEDGID